MKASRRALGRDDLIASYYTLAGAGPGQAARFSFAERVAAAATAGFAALGLLVDDYIACQAAGLSDATMRAILADHGMQIVEIEFLFDWCRADERAAFARRVEDQLYAMADAFGAHHMNVGDINPAGEHAALDAVAERFAALCDRAAAHGLRVAIEFLPWTDIPNAATAWEIARRAGRNNGGVLVDAWHYFRGTPDAAHLMAIPADRIIAVQLDDAAAERVGASFEDTLRRRLPGEGVFDLSSLIGVLDDIGVQAPVSVEIISPEHHALPLAAAAQRAHDSTRTVLARARTAHSAASGSADGSDPTLS